MIKVCLVLASQTAVEITVQLVLRELAEGKETGRLAEEQEMKPSDGEMETAELVEKDTGVPVEKIEELVEKAENHVAERDLVKFAAHNESEELAGQMETEELVEKMETETFAEDMVTEGYAEEKETERSLPKGVLAPSEIV